MGTRGWSEPAVGRADSRPKCEMLGPGATLRAFVASAIAEGLIAIFVAWRRGRLADTVVGTSALVMSAGACIDELSEARRDNRFAYAPAIAVGAIVAALV